LRYGIIEMKHLMVYVDDYMGWLDVEYYNNFVIGGMRWLRM